MGNASFELDDLRREVRVGVARVRLRCYTRYTANHKEDHMDLIETQRRRRGHKFYPTKAARVPALGATEHVKDPIVRAHYFVGSSDWYVLEMDPETGEAFGLADIFGNGGELGYFSLVELEATTMRGFLVVERDMHWTPKPLSKVR